MAIELVAMRKLANRSLNKFKYTKLNIKAEVCMAQVKVCKASYLTNTFSNFSKFFDVSVNCALHHRERDGFEFCLILGLHCEGRSAIVNSLTHFLWQ